MSTTRNFVYPEDDSSADEEEICRQNREDSSSDGSKSERSEDSSDDEPEVRSSRQMRNQESSSGESSEEDEEDHREDEMREHIQVMLTSLKDHYDQMMQSKVRDIENKKNVEIEEFRRQEKIFKEEMEALRAERGANVEVIEELRRELAEQRLTFEQTLENILEYQ